MTEVFGQAQESTDRVRKAIAHLSLWLFVALLSGAFCASYAGTIGGKQRDHVLARFGMRNLIKEAVCVQFCFCFSACQYRL